jgi:hypothetical protein
MEKKSTTTYITAKNRIGCRAPMEETDLVFISPDFSRFFKKIFDIANAIQDYCIAIIKIFPKLVLCKSISTQLSSGQRTTGQEKNYS